MLFTRIRAHRQKGVKRLSHGGIASVVDTRSALNRTNEQTMGRRHVTVGVEQEGGRGDCRQEGPLDLHLSSTELAEHVRGVAEVTGHVRADVRGSGKSAVPLGAPRTELRRASQRLDAT